MSEATKEAVLARCGELAKADTMVLENNYLFAYGMKFGVAIYQLGHENQNVLLTFSESTNANYFGWPLAAQILGIGETEPQKPESWFEHFHRLPMLIQKEFFMEWKKKNHFGPMIDNPYVSTDYAEKISQLPDELRMAYIEGDWTVKPDPMPTPQKDALIEKMCAEMAARNSQIDLDAYARGLSEMFDVVVMAEPRPSNEMLKKAWQIAAKHIKQPKGVSEQSVLGTALVEFEQWLQTIPPDPLQADRELLAMYFGKEHSVSHTSLSIEVPSMSEGFKLMNALKRLAGMEVGNV